MGIILTGNEGESISKFRITSLAFRIEDGVSFCISKENFMPTLVRVRKWGNSLGVRLPKSFTSQRDIVDGSTIEIDSLKVVDTKPRRRSRYTLKDLLRNYVKPPAELDFPPRGKEIA